MPVLDAAVGLDAALGLAVAADASGDVAAAWAVARATAAMPPVGVALALLGKTPLGKKRGSTGPRLPEMSEAMRVRMERARPASSITSRPACAWLYWLCMIIKSASRTTMAMAKVRTISSSVRAGGLDRRYR